MSQIGSDAPLEVFDSAYRRSWRNPDFGVAVEERGFFTEEFALSAECDACPCGVGVGIGEGQGEGLSVLFDYSQVEASENFQHCCSE